MAQSKTHSETQSAKHNFGEIEAAAMADGRGRAIANEDQRTGNVRMLSYSWKEAAVAGQTLSFGSQKASAAMAKLRF